MASAFQPLRRKVAPTRPTPSLMETIEKVAAAGELAGFSPQDLIEMLNGAMSVADLLDVIGYCLLDKRKPHASRELCLAAP